MQKNDKDDFEQIFTFNGKQNSIAHRKKYSLSDKDINQKVSVLENLVTSSKLNFTEETDSDQENGLNYTKDISSNASDFYNPLEDFKNESYVQSRMKKNPEIFSNPISCPNCFDILSRSYCFKYLNHFSGKNAVKFCLVKELHPENLLVQPQISVNQNFGVDSESNTKTDEINFSVKCKTCDEEVGFYNFNHKRIYLYRFLN